MMRGPDMGEAAPWVRSGLGLDCSEQHQQMRTLAPLLSEAHAYTALGSATAHGHASPKSVTTADGAFYVARNAIVAKQNDGFHEQPYTTAHR